jgi:hypothetical protein
MINFVLAGLQTARVQNCFYARRYNMQIIDKLHLTTCFVIKNIGK